MWWNAFRLGVREIRRNALRSFLTVLGIVIGVAAVIVIVTLGSGATLQIREQIGALGSNMLIARPGQRMGPGMTSVAPAFSRDDVTALRRDVPGVLAVAPSSTAPTTAIYDNTNWSTTVTGVDDAFFGVRGWSIERGRRFSESELRGGHAVCILGATVRAKIFAEREPLGEPVRLRKLGCQVIGLLATKGQSSMGTDQDDLVLVPLRMFQRRIAGNQEIRLLQMTVATEASTARVQRDIERLLRERRHLSAIEENNFTLMDMKEFMTTMTGTTRTLTVLLGAVGAVSLLVGGIGIMNIMLVSVTERTREIGIRLAVGALEREVLVQFLVEAVVLSALGGLLGIALALSGSWFTARALGIPFVPQPGIVLLSFMFSALVGVVFGYYPARKAARLNPIDALRHE
ncbi:MAG: ABC transporter permease [Gammaproteobacteria bacterium]